MNVVDFLHHENPPTWAGVKPQPVREQPLSSHPSQKIKQLFRPDEEPKPRFPDPIVRPIAVMPLSRMQNTTFVMPNITDYPDMGLRTVLTGRMPKKTERKAHKKLSYLIFPFYLVHRGTAVFVAKIEGGLEQAHNAFDVKRLMPSFPNVERKWISFKKTENL
ncbi:hypothetical protein TNCV_3783801 [Trichonephila clavipes]|nr:hypothetical protein TNCV_3783801 [Trichonephila clavipes]